MSGDRGVAESRAEALLKEAKVTDAERRSACVTLADIALGAAGGDRRAAGETLREVLETIGVLSYAQGRRGPWGHPGRAGTAIEADGRTCADETRTA